MENLKNEVHNSNEGPMHQTGVPIEVDKSVIMRLLGIGRDTARNEYNALLAFCNKGPHYRPCNTDLANYMRWPLEEVLMLRYSTKKQVVDMAFVEVKKIWINRLKREFFASLRPVIIKQRNQITDVIITETTGPEEQAILERITINTLGRLEIKDEEKTDEKIKQVIDKIKKQM